MGTGGMRYGAGRPGYKAKAEQLRKIDISRWQREGKLHAGDSFGWAWTMDGVQTASISVMVQSTESLRLLYTLGEDKRDASQQVRIDRTPCHFGNDRAWFTCPCCDGRSRVLFLRWGRFACRHCQKVAYESQSSDAMGRTWLKQRKLEAKLGNDWTRPKGMRQRTYAALLDALDDCEQRRDMALAGLMMRFMAGYRLARITG